MAIDWVKSVSLRSHCWAVKTFECVEEFLHIYDMNREDVEKALNKHKHKHKQSYEVEHYLKKYFLNENIYRNSVTSKHFPVLNNLQHNEMKMMKVQPLSLREGYTSSPETGLNCLGVELDVFVQRNWTNFLSLPVPGENRKKDIWKSEYKKCLFRYLWY